MTITTFIYALKEPDTGEIRYIGKSDDIKERLRLHISEAVFCKSRSHKVHWIRKLVTGKKEPLIEILDEVPVEHWQQWEVAYIEFFREQGCNLVNGTPGGDAGPIMFGNKHALGSKHSESTKEKYSRDRRGNQYLLGHVHSPETRKKMSLAHQNRKPATQEFREQRSRLATLQHERQRQEKVLAEMWR